MFRAYGTSPADPTPQPHWGLPNINAFPKGGFTIAAKSRALSIILNYLISYEPRDFGVIRTLFKITTR